MGEEAVVLGWLLEYSNAYEGCILWAKALTFVAMGVQDGYW